MLCQPEHAGSASGVSQDMLAVSARTCWRYQPGHAGSASGVSQDMLVVLVVSTKTCW